jgi:hypothetical protein
MTNDTDPAARARALTEDWITIWRSELASLADDPEAAELMRLLVAPWAAALVPPAARRGGDEPAGADAPAGAASADAPSDASERELARLRARVDELERRERERTAADPAVALPPAPARRKRRAGT